MRIHAIAGAAIYIAAVAGCSAELVERPPASDPGNVAAAEAPYHRPPSYEPDPLLSPVPAKSPEPPPTGHEQVHSPTATPPGNPPYREEPGGKPPTHHHEGAGGKPAPTVYTCPMHPEVRATEPGKCPKCGMTLVPVAPKGGGQ
jgi:Heavy metal binding domain